MNQVSQNLADQKKCQNEKNAITQLPEIFLTKEAK